MEVEVREGDQGCPCRGDTTIDKGGQGLVEVEVEVGEGGMNQECLIKARKSTRVGIPSTSVM